MITDWGKQFMDMAYLTGVSFFITLAVGLVFLFVRVYTARSRAPLWREAKRYHLILALQLGIPNTFRVAWGGDIELRPTTNPMAEINARLGEIKSAFKCPVTLSADRAEKPVLTVIKLPPKRRQEISPQAAPVGYGIG